MLSCEIYEMFKNTFFYRTPPVATSVVSIIQAALKKIKQVATSRCLLFSWTAVYIAVSQSED